MNRLLRALGLLKCHRCGSTKLAWQLGLVWSNFCPGPCTWDTGETKP